MQHTIKFINNHPPTSLLTQQLPLVLVLHLLLAEIAEVGAKPGVVLFEYPAIELRVSLRDQVIESVAVNEGFFNARVRVQVEVKLNVAIHCQRPHQLRHLEYRRTK